MEFKPKATKEKVKAGYRTLYITDELSDKISELATTHNTSFNNIVISIIEDFFNNRDY